MEDVKKSYHCDICGKDFKLSVTFKAHTVLHERESPYKCSWCGDVFVKSSIALKDHMRKHLDNLEKRKKFNEHNYSNEDNCLNKDNYSNEGSYLNKDNYSNGKYFNEHNYSNKGDKNNEKSKEHQVGDVNYECNYCQKKMLPDDNLLSHLRTHAGESPFYCSMCNQKYTRKESLYCHIRKIHAKAPSYICEFCEEIFDTKSVFERHSLIHEDIAEYKCKECKKVYSNKKDFHYHIRSHAIAMEAINHKRANSIGKKNQELFETVMERHKQELLTIAMLKKKAPAHIICEICDRIFYTKSDLEKHTQIHKNKPEYKCEECQKVYHSIKSFDNHRRSHVIAMEKKTRKRAQAIAVEKKNQEIFKAKVKKHKQELLTIAMLKKNQEKFAATCSKVRIYGNPIEALTDNVVEKNYTCNSCGKNLSSHKSVLNHMLMHAESALYSCKLCGIAFSNKAQLRMHVEKHADCNKFVDNVSVVCEALESQEKVTLHIKNDRTIKSNDRKIFMLEDMAGAPTKKKRRKCGANKREDVIIIDEDVVIDVEEVIIAEKGDDEVLDTDILY